MLSCMVAVGHRATRLPQIDDEMLAVGYGSTNGVDYYILKNSYVETAVPEYSVIC